MEQSFWILCRSPAAPSIPSCKYKASWLMATSAEFNILPAYTPSHFLCLLCRELWVLGKHSINKCIVRVTLRSGYSNNSSYFQKEKWLLFVSRGQQTTLLVSFQLFLCPPAIFIPPLLWLFFLHLNTSTRRGSPEVCLVRTVWPSSLSLAQCKYSWSERSWRIWAIW